VLFGKGYIATTKIYKYISLENRTEQNRTEQNRTEREREEALMPSGSMLVTKIILVLLSV
jgi:hypothetical protein